MIRQTLWFPVLLAWSGLLCSASGAAELAHAPAQWRGNWRLDRDEGASAISALGSAQVRGLLGTTLSLEDGGAALGELPCPSPSFQVSSESKEDFSVDFRIQAAEVGITGDPVKVLHINCGNYGYGFVRLTANRGLVIYQGHFFGTAKRIGR